mmetsp:Transcript_8714/g.13473  ORF Transcript_8714/g.13473 Transcript_8714/m.13473 type:complete len:90 (+) Transcript_8714:154-423(+)
MDMVRKSPATDKTLTRILASFEARHVQGIPVCASRILAPWPFDQCLSILVKMERFTVRWTCRVDSPTIAINLNHSPPPPTSLLLYHHDV